jgi:hypothetical protein
MVYQLIKSDPMRFTLGWMTAITLAVSPILAAKAPGMLPLACWTVTWLAAMAWGGNRASRFQAALPIAGRQLFLARMALLLAALWLPAFACIASARLLSGAVGVNIASRLLELAAASTLTLICLQALRPELVKISAWISLVPIWVIFAFTWQPQPSDRIAIAGQVTASCLLLSAVAFVWVWRLLVPKSYRLAPDGSRQDAPAEPRSLARPRSETRLRSSWAWMPVVRSVFFWQTSFVWLMLFSGAGSPGGGPTACFFLAMGWLGMRPRVAWLRALPVTRRAELAMLAVPALAILTAGFLFRGMKWVPEPHARILSLAVTLGWALATLLVLALYDWRPLSRVPFKLRGLFAVILVGVTPYLWMWKHPSTAALTTFAQYLFPASVPLSALVCAVPLLIMTWLLDRVAANPEYTSVPRMPEKQWFS